MFPWASRIGFFVKATARKWFTTSILAIFFYLFFKKRNQNQIAQIKWWQMRELIRTVISCIYFKTLFLLFPFSFLLLRFIMNFIWYHHHVFLSLSSLKKIFQYIAIIENKSYPTYFLLLKCLQRAVYFLVLWQMLTSSWQQNLSRK